MWSFFFCRYIHIFVFSGGHWCVSITSKHAYLYKLLWIFWASVKLAGIWSCLHQPNNNDFTILLISVEFPLICVGIRIHFLLVKEDFLSACSLKWIFSLSSVLFVSLDFSIAILQSYFYCFLFPLKQGLLFIFGPAVLQQAIFSGRTGLRPSCSTALLLTSDTSPVCTLAASLVVLDGHSCDFGQLIWTF